MESRQDFQRRIRNILNSIDPEVLAYNIDEFWMVQAPYEIVEYYAITNQLQNTAIALELARGLHNGSYRKLTVTKNGTSYRLPYFIHPLVVCRTLVDLQIPLEKDELDILLATALCHDMIEDLYFINGGKELYTEYYLDPRVYENVLYLSKRYDFTSQQEIDFFHNIEIHKLALMVKLSDRGNNVEDLYNMKLAKVYEYVGETDEFFIPMCEYGLNNYPELYSTFTMLKDKIITLTEAARMMVIRFEVQEHELMNQIKELQKENDQLRIKWNSLWRKS